MNIDEAKQTILAGIPSDISHFENPAFRTHHRNRSGLLLLERHRRAKSGWCRFEPSIWVGRSLSGGERKTFSRALKELEMEGSILTERDNRQRVSWISLAEQAHYHAR